MNFEWLAGVDAITGTVLHTIAYAVLLIWIFTRERSVEERGWRDLRLWVVPLIAIQVMLYWVF